MHILWDAGGRPERRKNLAETPCAPCRNPDRTTPTPSTTGGTAEATPRTRESETGPPAGRAIGRRETGGANPGTGPETGWAATPRTIGGPRSSPSGRHQAAGAGDRDGGRPGGRARRPPTRAVGQAQAPRSRRHGSWSGQPRRTTGPQHVRQHGSLLAAVGATRPRSRWTCSGAPRSHTSRGPAPMSRMTHPGSGSAARHGPTWSSSQPIVRLPEPPARCLTSRPRRPPPPAVPSPLRASRPASTEPGLAASGP